MIRWQDCIVTKAQLTRVALYLPQLPVGLNGLRIVQFGDLHTWGFRRSENHIYEILRRQEYDLLIISGDLCYPHAIPRWNTHRATHGNGKSRCPRQACIGSKITHALEVCRTLLADLDPPMGIYAVQGNHDSAHFVQELTSLGVHVLANTNCRLKTNTNEPFNLCGIRCRHRKYADVPAALLSLEPNRFTIAVCHYPEYAEALAAGGADLILCGHTHGGQACLPNGQPLITHSQTGKKYVSGLEQIGPAAVYTTRGVGSSVLPFRIFCPPEIVLLTLYKGDRSATEVQHVR